MKVKQCKGEGQGSCRRCTDNGKWNRHWMCFLYEVEGYEGCYCRDCVKEIRESKRAEDVRAEAINEFLKAIEDAISNLEYNAKTNKKTVTVETLVDQVDWVLHTILPKRIKEVAADLLEDFPNCKISGCEAARKDCHIGCPYGKENSNDSGTKI